MRHWRCLAAMAVPVAFSAVCIAHNDSNNSTPVVTVADPLVSIRPSVGYERIDLEIMKAMRSHIAIKDHALHDSLNGDGKIEAFEVYKKIDSNEICCIVKFGKSINGYPGIVHGGITALLLDNTFGWLFMALKITSAVTANLNINYRSPIRAGTCARIDAKVTSQEGRKLFMTATVENDQGKLLADATSLFITPKSK